MLPFSEPAVAPLRKGQESYKGKRPCKGSCSKPYAQFFSGALGTRPTPALPYDESCLILSPTLEIMLIQPIYFLTIYQPFFFFMFHIYLLCYPWSLQR